MGGRLDSRVVGLTECRARCAFRLAAVVPKLTVPPPLLPQSGSSVPGSNLGSGSPRTGSCVWRGAGADGSFSGDLFLARLARVALGARDGVRIAVRVRG